MRTSPATVYKSLAERGLVKKNPVKAEKNPFKPRFFERVRPNQLWQSDILTIRLGGHTAYLIGFIDDYSRYATALGMYRSQTAEHVLESCRRAVAEYGVPKEVLTDNGRQYTNWGWGEDPLRAGAGERARQANPLSAAPPDDAR